ncbi:hypothetical protein H5410_027534 [Solanum commersonii]|uniref:Uncharacterized protein n=1 Tax=Solanum commersonii TaxID=4109 RepID=A0A9J5Z044_SOLCO|nr:hypothetical protein H5410_027534 [Solanum commersonii]
MSQNRLLSTKSNSIKSITPTQRHSILRQDNPFSIFNDRSHMPLSFTPIPDENKQQGRTNLKSHSPILGPCLLRPGPSIQHVDLEVSKYDMSPEDHNLIKHGLPDDGRVRHERIILDNDLIKFDQEISQLYNLDKDDNLDSNLLIKETLLGNEEFYDAVEKQSNLDAVEEPSNSSLNEYRESSIAHIDLTEECGTILDVDEPPQLTKRQQRNRKRSKCHRQAPKARMAKLRKEKSTSTKQPHLPDDEPPQINDPKIKNKGYASFAGRTHTLPEIVHTQGKQRELPSSWPM